MTLSKPDQIVKMLNELSMSFPNNFIFYHFHFYQYNHTLENAGFYS